MDTIIDMINKRNALIDKLSVASEYDKTYIYSRINDIKIQIEQRNNSYR